MEERKTRELFDMQLQKVRGRGSDNHDDVDDVDDVDDDDDDDDGDDDDDDDDEDDGIAIQPAANHAHVAEIPCNDIQPVTLRVKCEA